MSPQQPAKLLRILISEGDRHQGRPLYQALVDKCRELKIAGATVLRGLEGYGETAGMHKGHLMRHDLPVVIVIVDAAENIARVAQAAELMMGTGVMAVSDVLALRVQKKPAAVV